MLDLIIKNGSCFIEGKLQKKDIGVKNSKIIEIADKISDEAKETFDAQKLLVLPGCMDTQVHFREPGLSHKGTIFSESRAAVAGGVTSYFEMPNTNPQTTTIENLKSKFEIAANNSLANYSFMFGGTNSNLSEIKKLDFNKIPGIKLFLGSSTGYACG